MSVIGFDIGNESCVIASAKRGGVDIVLNDESKRETPAVVSFGEKQRFLGSAGAAFATANLNSTVSQIKRLIGKLYKEVEEDLKLVPFVTREGPRGGVLIELEYLKRQWSFTPVEILGMLFKHLKQIAEKNLESRVVDCVIGIPSYFSDLQRRLYLDAATIAGLKPLRLMHDGTAIALGYGMYQTDSSDSEPTNVMFVDIGHCDTQVTVAAFEQKGMKILSHSFDHNLGGRDFDEVLFEHFAEEFNRKHNINIHSDVRASVKLRASCEKVKKVLSANAEAPLSIECLIKNTDVRGLITREEFENKSSKLLKRVIVPCENALKDAGLKADKLYTIELVGSGSRIPAITKTLTSFLKKEPTRTLNATECVARGCALCCAMLSPALKVRDYKIKDSFPYSIVGPSPQRGSAIVFPKGSQFADQKTTKYIRRTPFDLLFTYEKEKGFPAGISHTVGRFRIGPSEPSDAEKREVHVKMKVSGNGIIEMDSAKVLEHKPRSAWATRWPTSSHMLDLPTSGNLEVSTTNNELQEAKEKEKKLTEQDIKVEEIKDQRNTLESFVYDTRSKLSGAYWSFASDSEKKVLTKNLQETEDLLYEDSDDDEGQDYAGKLKDLKKLLEPIENKHMEANATAEATNTMKNCIAKYRSHADSFPAEKKEKILSECSRAENWLSTCAQNQPSPKNLSTEINGVIKYFESYCATIISAKPSSPRHAEPVDLDQKGHPMEVDQTDQPADSDQTDTHNDSQVQKYSGPYAPYLNVSPPDPYPTHAVWAHSWETGSSGRTQATLTQADAHWVVPPPEGWAHSWQTGSSGLTQAPPTQFYLPLPTPPPESYQTQAGWAHSWQTGSSSHTQAPPTQEAAYWAVPPPESYQTQAGSAQQWQHGSPGPTQAPPTQAPLVHVSELNSMEPNDLGHDFEALSVQQNDDEQWQMDSGASKQT